MADNRIAESCYVGKKVYWTLIKGGKIRSGTVGHIQGDFVTVKHGNGSSWLYADEIWSTKELAKEYPAK